MAKRVREGEDWEPDGNAVKAPKIVSGPAALQDARARIEALKAQLSAKKEEALSLYSMTDLMERPIDNVEDCKKACQRLSECEYIGVDGEWSGKGREARLSLLQVSFPVSGSSIPGIYLFDAFVGGKIMFEQGGLKILLEEPKITKILHDCRLDSDVLFYSFGIKLRGVIDTQVLYYFNFVQLNSYSPLPVSLKTLLRKFSSKPDSNLKDEAHALMEQNECFWEVRPMTPLMIQYAREDVLYLLEAYKRLWSGLDDRNHDLAISTSAGYAAQIRNMKQFPQERYSGKNLPTYGITTWDHLAKSHWDFLRIKYPGRFSSNATSETPDDGEMSKIRNQKLQDSATSSQPSNAKKTETKPKNLFLPPSKPIAKATAVPVATTPTLPNPMVKKSAAPVSIAGMPVLTVSEFVAFHPHQKR